MRSENTQLSQSIQATDPPSTESGTEQDLSRQPPEIADLEQIYTRHIGPVYGFLYKRVGNQEDAEDLAAETFLKASHRLDLSRSEASIVRWLFTVARTVLADHWRKYYRHGALLPLDELLVDPAADPPTAPAQRKELEHQVAVILDPLADRYRRVLELRFLHGYSVRETTQELGVTVGNAKVLQHRALAKAVRGR